MKPLKWTVILLAVLFVVFTFIPTSHSSTEVVNGFLNTTSSFSNQPKNASFLTSQYVDDEGVEDNVELPAASTFTTTIVAQGGYLFCDKDGNGIDGSVSSPIQPNRNGGAHTGEDIVPIGGLESYGANEVFACCPFAGEVVSAGYDAANLKSMGYNVRVQITEHVQIIYMHLGYGAGRAVQYSSYTTPDALVNRYPCQAVGYPDEWVTEKDWCASNGVAWQGVERYVGPSSICVAVGDKIEAGAVIGVPGDTGNSTGIHSHFAVRYTDSSNTKWYGSITELLSGTNMKDLNWMRGDGKTYTTAQQAGWDLDELDIQIVKGDDTP